jgi:hypothetical protein
MSNPNPISEYEEAMEQFKKDIKNKTSLLALLSLQNKILQAKLDDYVIPDIVLELLEEEKKQYAKVQN